MVGLSKWRADIELKQIAALVRETPRCVVPRSLAFAERVCPDDQCAQIYLALAVSGLAFYNKAGVSLEYVRLLLTVEDWISDFWQNCRGREPKDWCRWKAEWDELALEARHFMDCDRLGSRDSMRAAAKAVFSLEIATQFRSAMPWSFRGRVAVNRFLERWRNPEVVLRPSADCKAVGDGNLGSDEA